MNERKYESTFIPCGDALEKMELFCGIETIKEEPEQENQNVENPEVNG